LSRGPGESAAPGPRPVGTPSFKGPDIDIDIALRPGASSKRHVVGSPDPADDQIISVKIFDA
jgi:hypothetical protein